MRNPLRRQMRPNAQNESSRDLDNAVAAAADAEETSGAALLSKCPKSLHALWNEYEFGLANHKAAKDFRPSGRGKVKHVYARRNVLWHQKVSEMIRSG